MWFAHISAVLDVRELTETFDYEIICESPLFHTDSGNALQ